MTGTGEPTVSACSFTRVNAWAVLLGLSLVLRWRPAVPSTITRPSPPPTLKGGALGPSKPKARLVPTLVMGGDRNSGIAKAKVIPGPWSLSLAPGLRVVLVQGPIVGRGGRRCGHAGLTQGCLCLGTDPQMAGLLLRFPDTRPGKSPQLAAARSVCLLRGDFLEEECSGTSHALTAK